MKKICLFFLLMLFGIAAHSQAKYSWTKIDTVSVGYYIPLDSNVVSCKIVLTNNSKTVLEQNLTGNKIPAALIDSIGMLPIGSFISYTEITKLVNGKLVKDNAVKYVVGLKSTTNNVQRGTSLPIRIKAEDLAQLQLDNGVTSFVVSMSDGTNFNEVKASGKKMPALAAENIRKMPAGSRIYVGQILSTDSKGNELRLPLLEFRLVK